MSLITISAALRSLESISSRTAIASILRLNDTPMFRSVLWSAYNPFMTYGLTVEGVFGMLSVRGNDIQAGDKPLDWEIVKGILAQLARRELSGNAAVDTVCLLLDGVSPSQAWVVAGILNKDFRVGISSKTINAVFPNLIPVFELSLAAPFNRKALKFPAIAEVKYDGKRIAAIVTSDGVRLYSRNGIEEKGYQHIRDELSLFRATQTHDCMLDGELMFGMFGDRKGKESEAVFHVFDGMPLSNWQTGQVTGKQKDRSIAIREALLFAPHGMPHIQPANWRIVENEDEITAFYDEVIAAGGEGLIIKDPEAPYTRKRGNHWLKMKEVNDADLPIVGVFEGEGKYTGMLGGIIVDFNGGKVRVGSGFSDDQRGYYSREQAETLIGQTAECKYTEITPDGSLRFPRFVRIRNDK